MEHIQIPYRVFRESKHVVDPKVMESLNMLYDGVDVKMADNTTKRVRCMITQIRGDWKWHKDCAM